MKNLLLTALLVVISLGMYGQFRIKSEEMSSVLKRPLVVELMEEHPNVIKRLEKKKSSKNEKRSSRFSTILDEYRAGIKEYNSYIKEAIESHWTLNENYEFKTTSEIAKLVNKETDKYSVLRTVKSTEKGVVSYSRGIVNSGSTRFGVNMLALYKIEDIKKAKDNYLNASRIGFATPQVWVPEEDELFTKGSVQLSLRIMQAHILSYQKIGKKQPIEKFIKQESSANCSGLGDQEVSIPTGLIFKKASISEMNSNYRGKGEVKEISNSSCNELLETTEDRVVGISLPWKIVSGSGGAVTVSRIMFIRTLINLATLEMYTAYGAEMGQVNTSDFRNNEFKRYGMCK